MQKIGIHHIAIRVKNYEESKKFYTEGLGAECYAEWNHWKGFQACMMRLNNGGIIEMLGSGKEGMPDDFEEVAGCYIHLALEVENVEEAVARAVANGGTQKGEIKDNEIPSPMHIGVVFGPSGEIIEFLKQIG